MLTPTRWIALPVLLALCAVLAPAAPLAWQSGEIRPIAAGQNMELKGAVISRDGEQFVLRTLERADYRVLLTDSTDIRTERKGAFRKGKEYDMTSILVGLILDVEGTGDADGRLVAKKIRFSEDDLHSAITAQVRAKPIEQSVAATNERIANLDEWEERGTVTVTFATNSARLTPEATKQLDELAAKAPGATNYKVEVRGFTDSSGSLERNIELSQQRADAVVKYLTIKHNIPLRRISTPMGYASTQAAADNATAQGRAQNRRVDVVVFINKGLAQQAP
jgi:outer membrane protein OmpA-like peptidoglycan-associated protein